MSSAYAEFYNINGARRIGDAIVNQYYISCNYKPGDKVRYEWNKGEIRICTVTRIDYAVIISDSVTGNSRSVPLEFVIGYAK